MGILFDERRDSRAGSFLDLRAHLLFDIVREDLAFTSAQRRIQAAQEISLAFPDCWLAPLPLDERGSPGPSVHGEGYRCSDKGFLSTSLADYLELLDWTGRQVVRGKTGSIPEHLPPILVRLGIESDDWLKLATNFGSLFHRVAGHRSAVERERTRRGGHFRPGRSRLFGRG